MKFSIIVFLFLIFISSTYGQDVSYYTVTTTSMDSSNPTSIRIKGQNDPVGILSSRKISFEFSSAGKAQINAYRENSWGTSLQFLTSDDSDIGGIPSVRMHIHRTGDVGIGTTSPLARLSVVHGTGYGKVANFSSALGDEQVGIGTESNGFSWIGTTSNHNFQIHANSEAKVTVLANGNVGIGTTTPNDYRLAVNGKIRAQEIKVENTNWPDYVFSKCYPLPTLQETEKHLKENGHLLGVPSAEEVKANGIDLGEMNAKLLLKIEELTLYLIEQNKMIKRQQQEIDALKTAITLKLK